ncbi:sensor histidine kinase [Phenylobacterium sp.]|uniref:sensor histidine kinase n=1 Tax=Phenylobacterium sp. TaxID=1871053 RepID=UPI002FCC273D
MRHAPKPLAALANDVSPAAVAVLKKAQDAFHERELHLRALLDALPAAVYTTDAEGRITFYNEACVAFAGRRPVIGSDEWCVTWKLYWPDGTPLPHDQCPMALALKDGRPVRGAEAVAERPDGSRISFTPYPTPLLGPDGQITGAVNVLVDITHRKQAEERLSLLANEVNHRANNLLSIVQATVRLTQADNVEDFRDTLDGRIGALAHAHSLLAKSRWAGADLSQLVQEELAPYVGGQTPRVWVSGPSLPLQPEAAQSLAMALHELATNAAKYGALSAIGGRVEVSWVITPDQTFELQWHETGGPATTRPLRSGVGGSVVKRAMRHLAGSAEFDWLKTGLQCRLTGQAGLMIAPAPETGLPL